jgi:TolB-like protein
MAAPISRALEVLEMPDSAEYLFGPFKFDARVRVLYRGGRIVDLPPKAAEILALLLTNAGAVIEKNTLLDAAWAGRIVGESSLTRTMSILRSRLGRTSTGDSYIATISKRGYRFAVDVATSSAAAMMGGDTTIAVLPFNTFSAGPDQEFFSDGLTEEITAQLYKRGGGWLQVMARTTCMTFKNSLKRIDVIGRELGVGYVLEGSVRRHGGRLRIAAQLIRVRDQMHVWAENYERRIGNVLRLQCLVAVEIAREVQLMLSTSDIGAI